jgi:DHA2 family multidrug resistance protein
VLIAKGDSLTDAAHKAHGMVYGTLVKQSTMMAFVDTFWIMGALCLCLLPLLFLMRRTRATHVEPGAGAH